jgi:DNA-binding MarR family transcriptional regulator
MTSTMRIGEYCGMAMQPSKLISRKTTAAGRPMRKNAANTSRAKPQTASHGGSNTPEGAKSPVEDETLARLALSLITLANVMRCNQEQFASYMRVSVPRFLVMRMLEQAPRSTVTEIAARLEVTSQFVTLETRRLIEQGLLAKEPNELDRRSVILDLTPAGRRLLQELRPLRQQTNERMFRSLRPDQIADMQATVLQLIEDGREALHQLQTPNWRERRAPSLRASNEGGV